MGFNKRKMGIGVGKLPREKRLGVAVFDGLTFNFFLGNLKIRHKISNIAPSGWDW